MAAGEEGTFIDNYEIGCLVGTNKFAYYTVEPKDGSYELKYDDFRVIKDTRIIKAYNDNVHKFGVIMLTDALKQED